MERNKCTEITQEVWSQLAQNCDSLRASVGLCCVMLCVKISYGVEVTKLDAT